MLTSILFLSQFGLFSRLSAFSEPHLDSERVSIDLPEGNETEDIEWDREGESEGGRLWKDRDKLREKREAEKGSFKLHGKRDSTDAEAERRTVLSRAVSLGRDSLLFILVHGSCRLFCFQ